MLTPPVLTYPNWEKPFLLRTDASGSGLGAVLTQQVQEGEDPRPVAYASRALHGGEKHYSPYRLEFKAVHWAVTQKFSQYLKGRKFVITTDHNPLVYILTTAKLDATTIRWVGELADYDFEIYYKSGSQNTDADVMSRIFEPQSEGHITQDMFRCMCRALLDNEVCPMESMAVQANCIQHIKTVEPEINGEGTFDWNAEQNQDHDIRQIKRYVKLAACPSDAEKQKESHQVLAYLRHFDRLVLKDDVLFRRRIVDGEEDFQIVLPQGYRDFVWDQLHVNHGHPGRDRQLSLIADRFWFPGVTTWVENKLKSCRRCVVANGPSLPQAAPMVPIVSHQPLEVLCIDFLTVEPSGGCGNILVVSDHFSKFAQAYATRNQTARTTARILYENFVCNYGWPGRVHSDEGANFESELVRELCLLANVKKSRTTPYHPQGNRVTERFNRSLIRMLRTLTEDKIHNGRSFLVH